MEKVIFIQLPLSDHGMNYIEGNVQYAPASLAAFLSKNNKIETIILDVNLQNFASNKIICDNIFKASPDTVVFCNYLWNIERHLSLAEDIKRINENIKIYFGGPEINAESFVFNEKNVNVDFFVCGEGEWFFKRFFENNAEKYKKLINGNILYIQPQDELVEMKDVVEPYTSGFLKSSYGNSIFIEITRGCHFRCSYCYYSKSNKKVREADKNILLNAVKKGEVDEIYILSPTFCMRNDLYELLDEIKKYNTKGINFHTELRPDLVDKKMAEALFSAGINSLEVGIQTLTPEALKIAGRPANREKTIQGLIFLKEAGISLKIGLIPGLPGDSFEDFAETVYILEDNGFGYDIEFYPLMVLPGTEIRKFCEKNNLNYIKKPPYFFKEGPHFKEDEIRKIKHEIELMTGFNSDIFKIPDFVSDENPTFFKGVFIDGKREKWNFSFFSNYIETSVFTVAGVVEEKDIDYILKKVSEYNDEWTLFNIAIFGNYVIEEDKYLDYIKKEDSNDFYRRMNFYENWKSGMMKYFYHLTDSFEIFEIMSDQYFYIEPILILSTENILKFDNLDFEPFVYVGKKFFEKNKEWLKEKYVDYYDRVTFESKEDRICFYKECGINFTDFNFKTGFKQL